MAQLPIFLKKSVFNRDLVNYSGEVYLFLWATGRLGRNEGEVLRTIKDNSILSSLAGFVVSLVLPLVCFALGLLAPQRTFTSYEIVALTASPLLVCAVCGLLTLFHRLVFSLPLATLAEIGAIHLLRFLVINVLTVVQWYWLMPDQPLYVWCTLLVAQNPLGVCRPCCGRI